jgi:hypothetical protein
MAKALCSGVAEQSSEKTGARRQEREDRSEKTLATY